MENDHYLTCEAPICTGDPNPNYKDEVIWYAGEPICGLTGTRGQRLQKIQRRINKRVNAGTFKNPDLYFTGKSLEKITKVTNATKGLNPDKPPR